MGFNNVFPDQNKELERRDTCLSDVHLNGFLSDIDEYIEKTTY
ncbi:MAG: hypothetical protein AB8V73_01155 [Coxiella endosymbiont of Dermacentor nuttalli]